ncbi:PP2C family serine/threonine-protein phosphatase [Bacteroides sp. 224]|uniref:PP2C family serine/threonine-protein phosphatase n=1 Tax=Bacteroides sp. 224 TaxID=2302936 RepID=UPI0013D8A39B|nr:PP2C family serine/threonine-protein phosphatase [Bacteroides sp. 224]NDV65002.1 protein phosphatase 2C domain-containing protein [Bacteroides sp. 224]
MKEYLQQIGVSFDTDEQMQEFISLYEESIHDFIRKKRDEFLQQNTVTEEECKETKEECKEMQEASENSQKKGPENYQKETAQNEVFNMQLRNKHISLPNGKVNQEYRFFFNVEELLLDVGEFSFEGLSDIGLNYDPETKEITGIPNKHGDAKIKLKCKRKDWEEGKPIFEREINMIINPDPKSLWNNIPTETDIDYYKPDYDKGFVKVESKRTRGILGFGKKELPQKDMVAASQRGRSHAHEGKPRDDDFALYFDDANEWYVMTVADGAGSAQYSRKGSQIACNTVVEVCKELINTHAESLEKTITVFNEDKSQTNRNEVGKILYNIIGTAVFKSYKNIEKEALEKGAPLKNYSTTLIVSVCKKFSFGWFVGAFWVGDGGIGIYHKDTQYLKVLGEADGGEFAGQTRFLTMPEIMQNTEIYRRLRFDVVEDFTALILMTDGVTDPKFETDANLLKIEKWNDLWDDLSAEVDLVDDNEESAYQLLRWLDFWSPGNHDDRTIAILF